MFPRWRSTSAAAAIVAPAVVRWKDRSPSPSRAWSIACVPSRSSRMRHRDDHHGNSRMSDSTNYPRSRTELLLLVACCGFLLFYGLGAFGLLGADEPRYAQVAREMLGRNDWVSPTLNGKPWLEKPPLYYWQAMLSYRVGRALLPAKREDGATGAPARPN